MRTARTTLAITALMLLAACGGVGDTATVDPGSSESGSSESTTESTTEPGAPGSPSESASTPPDPAPTELSITTSLSAEAAATEQRSYLLTCDPPGGDHPDPAAACAVIAELGAEAFTPPPKDQQCTQQYGGPQTASVTGVVDGVAVQTTIDRTDGCGIARWDALAPVLAAPVGGGPS